MVKVKYLPIIKADENYGVESILIQMPAFNLFDR